MRYLFTLAMTLIVGVTAQAQTFNPAVLGNPRNHYRGRPADSLALLVPRRPVADTLPQYRISKKGDTLRLRRNYDGNINKTPAVLPEYEYLSDDELTVTLTRAQLNAILNRLRKLEKKP